MSDLVVASGFNLYSRPFYPFMTTDKFSFSTKKKYNWDHGDPKRFFRSSILLNQLCYIVSMFPDFSLKYRFSLTTSWSVATLLMRSGTVCMQFSYYKGRRCTVNESLGDKQERQQGNN